MAFFETLDLKCKRLMGTIEPLTGPEGELWVSPSDQLIGKVRLTPPLTNKYIMALTHMGIMEIGGDVEERRLEESRIEKETALEENKQLIMIMAEQEFEEKMVEVKKKHQKDMEGLKFRGGDGERTISKCKCIRHTETKPDGGDNEKLELEETLPEPIVPGSVEDKETLEDQLKRESEERRNSKEGKDVGYFQRKVRNVVKQLQEFIDYASEKVPSEQDFLIRVEKLMFDMNDILDVDLREVKNYDVNVVLDAQSNFEYSSTTHPCECIKKPKMAKDGFPDHPCECGKRRDGLPAKTCECATRNDATDHPCVCVKRKDGSRDQTCECFDISNAPKSSSRSGRLSGGTELPENTSNKSVSNNTTVEQMSRALFRLLSGKQPLKTPAASRAVPTGEENSSQVMEDGLTHEDIHTLSNSEHTSSSLLSLIPETEEATSRIKVGNNYSHEEDRTKENCTSALPVCLMEAIPEESDPKLHFTTIE